MKYYLIAGERSGDLHASNLIKAIQEKDTSAEFRFWGGDYMAQTGGTLVKHYRETAFMGIWEVIRNLHKVSAFLKECEADILAYQPDVVILVDYSGFNMRIAKALHKKAPDLPRYYYISPKLWAWNTGRAKKVKRLIDRMFVIFPFEVDFYQQFDYPVDYVGNPLLDSIAQFVPNPDFREKHKLGNEPLIALLPGSRHQEVQHMLTVMLSIRQNFPNYRFVIAGVSNLQAESYQAFTQMEGVELVTDETYDLLSQSEAALVTSGTATLETALFNIPQVVVYRTSLLTFWVGKILIKVPYLSLVNLIGQKEVVKELIQKELNPTNLSEELLAVTEGGAKRAQVLADYAHIREKMGEAGASQRAGLLMVQYLNGDKAP